MKRFVFIIGGCLLVLSGCVKDFDAETYNKQKNEAKIVANANRIFGDIDPVQDWNSITTGTISVTADAALNDIVKVQILTESPFLNDNARVLAEANAKQGQAVSLSYDAPNAYKQLIAACVNSKGHYRIQVFNIGDQSVNFQQGTTSRAMRASKSEAPTFTTLKLNAPHWSLNALRAQQGATCKISGTTYTVWSNSNWSDQMWDFADNQKFDGGWTLDSKSNMGHIYRTIDGFAPGEKENVEAILKSLFVKYASDEYSTGTSGKKNNARIIRKSPYVTQNNNCVYSDGINPITLIPIQSYNTEFKLDRIFYYFYKPSEVPAGMSEVDYIKSLPKFKAIQVERVQSSTDGGNGTLYRKQEFLLPYIKGTPQEGVNEASAIFPKGYKIGFLCQKNQNDDYNYGDNKHGCVYADGRLNVEVNHIKGHFFSAIDKTLGGNTKEGMQFDDPRMAMFTANEKTYICIEDGADCNFSDIVLEIGGGVDQLEEEPEVMTEAYTMCFEDRLETADYDLNDVVLRCRRIDNTTLELSLIATGANDNVYIHGATGWEWNDQEAHAIFGVITKEGENRFVNTENGSDPTDVKSSYVTINEGITIPQYLKNIYIENRTTGKEIRVSKQGEPPYAIIVPQDFQYPMEHTRITEAYAKFLEWAQNANKDKNWYVFEEADKIFPSLFKKE